MLIGIIRRTTSKRLFFSAKSFIRQVIFENNLTENKSIELSAKD
jgi:hypothetical protein